MQHCQFLKKRCRRRLFRETNGRFGSDNQLHRGGIINKLFSLLILDGTGFLSAISFEYAGCRLWASWISWMSLETVALVCSKTRRKSLSWYMHQSKWKHGAAGNHSVACTVQKVWTLTRRFYALPLSNRAGWQSAGLLCQRMQQLHVFIMWTRLPFPFLDPVLLHILSLYARCQVRPLISTWARSTKPSL